MVNLNVKEGIDASSSLNNKIPTGALMMKASAASLLTSYATDASCISAGYVPCDGRILNATTFTSYQNLFNIIGNIYGGTNNTNFKVPDLRTSRRYIYGQPTAVSSIYTPSFSANTTNAVTHSHTVSGMNATNLTTNVTAGTHSHNTFSGSFGSSVSANHSHYANFNVAAFTTGGAAGTTLTKSDGTGTAAGAAHTHTSNSSNVATNSGEGSTSHAHGGRSLQGSSSHTEPTHTHSIDSSNTTTPVSSGIDIPYVNVLYFIKI
jgi:microcystin-dependent protein